MTRSENMEHVEVLRDIRNWMASVYWDSRVDALDAAIAALSAPQPPAEAQADEVMCAECGQPTMHMGQVCYACDHPAEAQAQGGGDFRCPECYGEGGRRWYEADGSERGERCGTCDGLGHIAEPPSASVGVEAMMERAYEVVHHDADCPSIGGNGDADCRCDAVPFLRDLRDALAQQPAAVDGACAWNADDDGVWHGSCGAAWCLEDGGPAENSMRHCPQCGKQIALAAQPGGSDNDR